MSTNTKKNNTAAAIVDSIIDNANVPNMDKNATKYERKAIIDLEVNRPDSVDLFDIIDEEVARDALHIPNGKNRVRLIGCYRVKKLNADKTNKEWLEMHIRDINGAEEVVSLFPGNAYTDKLGVVHPAGHNWKAFAEEIKRQKNAEGVGMPPMKLGEILVKICTKGFDTWILNDGTYTNMYANENKYQNALDKLAKDRKAGSPKADKAPWEK